MPLGNQMIINKERESSRLKSWLQTDISICNQNLSTVTILKIELILKISKPIHLVTCCIIQMLRLFSTALSQSRTYDSTFKTFNSIYVI